MKFKSKPQQDFFKRVHLSERKALFQSLAAMKSVIFVKAPQDEVHSLMGFRLDSDENLYCTTSAAEVLIPSGSDAVVNFHVGEERYFFRTQIFHEGPLFLLKVNVDLFQLQRRQNARFDLPEDYTAHVNISEINGRKCFIEARILDISAGGCKVFTTQKNLVATGDRVELFVHLGVRRPLPLSTDVRFAANGDEGQTFGVQFEIKETILENKLLMIMVDLQRELYLKTLKGGK